MATTPLTVDTFAKSLKTKYPQYASVPDASLVEAVLAKYPQYKSQLGGAAPPAPGAPPPDPKDFVERMLARTSQNAEGLAQTPGAILTDARQRYLARNPQSGGEKAIAAGQSAFEGAYHKGVEPLVEGLSSLTTPGLLSRVAGKEDPATIAADMATMMIPGEEGTLRGERAPAGTKAGPLWGSMRRAKAGMDFVDAHAQGIPINVESAYTWAQRAAELGKRGFTVPKPISDFITWIDNAAKPGADAIPGQPRSFVDRAPQSTVSMPYEVARDFEQSLGAKIPWEADPGGKMNGLMKQTRQALGGDVSAGLRPYGLSDHYLRAKANFEKAFGAQGKYGIYGKLLGKVAGYGTGGAVGHPLILGYAGGKAGESLAGSLVRSVTEAGGERPRPATQPRGMSEAELEARGLQYIEQLRRSKQQAPPATTPRGMGSQATELWQQSVFGKQPEPDIGTKVRQANPEPKGRGIKDVANPARDTSILEAVRREHPDWSLSQQLMEAARRANPR